MKPNTIAASNETLACEMSKLIVKTDLNIQKKQLENQSQCEKETNHVKWEAEYKAGGVSSRTGGNVSIT